MAGGLEVKIVGNCLDPEEGGKYLGQSGVSKSEEKLCGLRDIYTGQ